MQKKLLMGNEAIALGAIHAGVNVVSGYPGTPSTEVLETVAKNNDGSIYVEWSTNEKSALEVSAGACYTGARTLVTMKQVGLNVASDPLMSLRYVGVKGGMVIVVADDPGPISSQTEQDTRHFGIFSKIPVFDPSSPQEAYDMMSYAFEVSEKYQTPVILRPTTRVCHSCATVSLKSDYHKNKPEGFIKDSSRWVVFPSLTYKNHIKIENDLNNLSDEFSDYQNNKVFGSGKKGIVSGGISYEYVMESNPQAKIFKVSTPTPFPKKLALEFLNGLEEVLVVEELDPVIENELTKVCAENNINIVIKGKKNGFVANAGENSSESVKKIIAKFLGEDLVENEEIQTPNLPVRPPVLCAGCPHRASFFAVKEAAKSKKAIFCGDIGCYTLGNAKPLDMVDTCLCMGAGITMAQGLSRIEKDTVCFSFIGDSTFFHTGIAGIVNGIYNQSDIIVVILDNSTTAMTGNQPHPGTGKTMMGDVTEKIDIQKVLEGLGVKSIRKLNPFDFENAKTAVKDAMDEKGVRAIIFQAPCIAITKNQNAPRISVNDKCIGCNQCVNKLGCPAISIIDKKASINENLCNGCGLCVDVCKFDAIGGRNNG